MLVRLGILEQLAAPEGLYELLRMHRNGVFPMQMLGPR